MGQLMEGTVPVLDHLLLLLVGLLGCQCVWGHQFAWRWHWQWQWQCFPITVASVCNSSGRLERGSAAANCQQSLQSGVVLSNGCAW